MEPFGQFLSTLLGYAIQLVSLLVQIFLYVLSFLIEAARAAWHALRSL
jgi:hypothetical protein